MSTSMCVDLESIAVPTASLQLMIGIRHPRPPAGGNEAMPEHYSFACRFLCRSESSSIYVRRAHMLSSPWRSS